MVVHELICQLFHVVAKHGLWWMVDPSKFARARVNQKVKGLFKKAHLLKMYRNETNITFQRNAPQFQRTSSSFSQVF
jgi:hypothetical protein